MSMPPSTDRLERQQIAALGPGMNESGLFKGNLVGNRQWPFGKTCGLKLVSISKKRQARQAEFRRVYSSYCNSIPHIRLSDCLFLSMPIAVTYLQSPTETKSPDLYFADQRVDNSYQFNNVIVAGSGACRNLSRRDMTWHSVYLIAAEGTKYSRAA